MIKGEVIDEMNKPIPFVNILIKTDSSDTVLAYTYSKDNGKYLLETTKKGKFNLTFSALGYKTQMLPIEITNEIKAITKNIVLKEEAFSLDEVIIHAEKPVTIKKDTIIFNAQHFLQGNEVVVEDLLKKIPGISVDSEGTIKIGNKEIEKVMVDGDDFFEKGYKILTKNMPPSEIDKIELLQRYSNNKLLKNIEESDKVALNLVLKENAKRQWFGNLSVGYDITLNNRYSLRSNVMNFGKKNKYFFLSNINNIGYNATGDVNHLIRPFRYGEPSSIGDNQSAYSILNVNSFTPNFKSSRTNFNNAKLVSLNSIFTLSKKVKLKTLGFFNWDENKFFRNRSQTFISNSTDFTNTEGFSLKKKRFIGFGKIDFSYDISKTKMFETTTKYNNQNNNNQSNLVFNQISTIEKLNSDNTLFDQKITFTNKFKKNKVLLLTGRYINEKTPQDYHINHFFYQDLFPDLNNTNNVSQLSKNKMTFVGFETHLLDRKENGNLLELQIGNQFRKDLLFTSFALKENNITLNLPASYQNNINYSSNNLYFKTKYRLKLNNDVSLIGKLNFHQLFNKLIQDSQEFFKSKQHPFFINPTVALEWEINNKNKTYISFTNSTSNAKIIDVYSNYILTGFRSFSKGIGSFDQLNTSTLVFNYQLGDWSDNFFVNTSIIYKQNHDFFSTNSLITQNYSQSEKIIIKDRKIITIFSDLNRYIKSISSNLKFDVGFSKSNYKNIINNSELREIKSVNYNVGFELRSGFSGMFNYHVGSKWTVNEIKSTIDNSFINNVSFLNLSFDFNNKVDIQIQTERYFFGNTGQENNIFYFADLSAKYIIKKNKLELSVSGKNLFNTNTFKSVSINDISTSTTEYRLLPRYILLKVKYRF